MTPEEIRENNKLIADYMNYPNSGKENNDPYFYAMVHCYEYDLMKYHNSWDWLMPAIKKLNETILFGIWAKAITYASEHIKLNEALSNVNIEEAYQQVVNIIKKDIVRKINKEINP